MKTEIKIANTNPDKLNLLGKQILVSSILKKDIENIKMSENEILKKEGYNERS
jgi:hypothetical protein